MGVSMVQQVGFPAVYDLDAWYAARDAAPPLRYTADGRYRIAYTLASGEDVRVSPHAGAVPIVRWLTREEAS